MSTKILTNDLDNCLINFNRKVLVTNLLEEYGGLLDEIAKTVQEFLANEEQKGKEFEKIFLLRGRQLESEDEVITFVPDAALNQRKELLRDAQSILYSAEVVGGSKSPPEDFVPLRRMAIKLDSLEFKDIRTSCTGTTKDSAAMKNKNSGTLGIVFKKQETSTAIAVGTAPEIITPKNSEAEKKSEKSVPLGTMFKKQETLTSRKSTNTEIPERKYNPLGAMFKKQEENAAIKKCFTETKDKSDSKSSKNENDQKAIKSSSFPKKNENQKVKSPVSNEKERLNIANVSVNLFDESESSLDDEEALDALKCQLLTDDESGDKPTTSNKRRRIIDSDSENPGPEVKIERKEFVKNKEETTEVSEEKEPKKSETFMVEDGFIVTKKHTNLSAPKKPNPSPTKVKKESPKSSKKKKAQSNADAPKIKQGNILNFFTKK